MTDNIRASEDQQILTETVTNERIVDHPTRGKVRFRMPTLEVQRKIDTLSRTKKKILRDTIDKIPDPDAPNGYRIVPAYKSREILAKEYAALGWWTEEHDQELLEVTREYTDILTQLELLQFESEDYIYMKLSEHKDRLLKLFEESVTDELKEVVFRVCMVGGDPEYADLTTLRDAAPSTEVDDIINEILILRKQYDCYMSLAKCHIKLFKIESERTSLFQDSWQDQLQYYIRLAQVYSCCDYVDSNKPLYNSIDEMEKETDLEFLRWVFTELQAFFQGTSSEARERLSKYSFTDRLNSKPSSSEESPVQPVSKQDGDSPTNKQTPSSEATVTTDQ